MRAKSFLSLLSIALVLGACKKDLEPQEASATSATATPEASVQNTPDAQMVPTTTATPNMAVTPTATPAQVGNVAAGMNPAHGQPGHRCDIAVGAPLNSPAKAASGQPAMTINPNQASGGNQAFKVTPTPSAATPAMLQPPANTAAATTTAPGMNPPHGQPGHRCDISVGAPLSSAPSKPAGGAEPAKAEPKMDITVSDPAKAQ